MHACLPARMPSLSLTHPRKLLPHDSCEHAQFASAAVQTSAAGSALPLPVRDGCLPAHLPCPACTLCVQTCTTTLTVTGGQLVGAPGTIDVDCPPGSYYDASLMCPIWCVGVCESAAWVCASLPGCVAVPGACNVAGCRCRWPPLTPFSLAPPRPPVQPHWLHLRWRPVRHQQAPPLRAQ